MLESLIGLYEKSFAEKSTPEQWQARGDQFYRRNLYNVAAKCYSKSGDEKKEKIALAQQMALDATNHKTSPKK